MDNTDFKNVLITGGCGFIGSNCVNYFVNKYPNINFYNLDILYYCASLKNILVSDKPNYTFIKGDLCDNLLIDKILNDYQIDAVIHYAAQSHVDNSFESSLQYTRDNVLGSHTLLECCRRYGKLKRFIFVSTDEVYGTSYLEDTEADIKTETHILCPSNPYAGSKAAAEMIANSYFHSYKLPIIITRGNNCYGTKQYPEKLIPKFINLLLDNKKCTLHGKGDTVRSFIHVDDVARGFDTVLFKGVIGEIYNIGCLDEYSVLDITKILVKKLNKGNYEDWITFVSDRNFNDKRYYIQSKKLNSLGWKTQISFEDGINETIKWYIENKDNWS